MKRVLKFLLAHKYTLSCLLFIISVWSIIYLKTISIPIIQQWDEARNAVNTQEMLQNGNLLVRHFQGKPDNWELKPPLLIWLQCLSTKIFGLTEFGIRLPSALATLGLSLLTFFFLLAEKLRTNTATLSAVMVITLPAALHPHGFLFGDHDALLCFFQALLIVAQYRFLQNAKTKWLWLSASAFLLGWLTKSVAICFILPGIWTFGLLNPEYRKNLFSLKLLTGFFTAFMIVILYYVIRNHYQPGYSTMVNQEEWLGRFAKHPDANHDIFYYIKGFYHDRLQGFVFPALAGVLWAIYSWKKNKLSQLGFLLVLITLTVISLSQSKNYWYDLPLLFPVVLCMALLFDSITRFTDRYMQKSSILMGLIALFFVSKNALKISNTHDHKVNPNKKEILIQHLKNDLFDKTLHYGIYCNAFNTDVLFYLNNLKLKGYVFTIVEPGGNLNEISSVLMAREDEDAWKKQRKISAAEPALIIFQK